MRKLLTGVGVAAALMIGAPALAQTTTTVYSGNTTTTTGAPTTATENNGPVAPGGTITFTDCNFQPNSSVSRTLNATNVPNGTVDSSTCTRTTITDQGPPATAAAAPVLAAIGAPRLFAQQTTGSVRRVSIDGTVVNGRVGTNTLVIQGTGTNGATRQITHVFELSGSKLPADAARSTAGKKALARTGLMVGGLAAFAAILLAVGTVLVRGSKRKALR